jgi:hypothetical protein
MGERCKREAYGFSFSSKFIIFTLRYFSHILYQEIDSFNTAVQVVSPPSQASSLISTSRPGHVKSAEIISLLNIPPTLITRPKAVDLRLAYSKYAGFLQAQADMLRMIRDGTWTLGPITNDELIEIFVSKSVYHANYPKLFTRASDHPAILAWLKNEDGAPTGLEVFGEQKFSYTFRDLKGVLDAGKEKRKSTEDDGERIKKKSKKSSSSKHQRSGSL